MWILNGVASGALMFFFSKWICQSIILNNDGHNGDMWIYSIVIYT